MRKIAAHSNIKKLYGLGLPVPNPGFLPWTPSFPHRQAFPHTGIVVQAKSSLGTQSGVLNDLIKPTGYLAHRVSTIGGSTKDKGGYQKYSPRGLCGGVFINLLNAWGWQRQMICRFRAKPPCQPLIKRTWNGYIS